MRGKGGMCGKGGPCVVKGSMYGMQPPYEIRPVNARAVRLLLECILGFFCAAGEVCEIGISYFMYQRRVHVSSIANKNSPFVMFYRYCDMTLDFAEYSI